ncbi:GNAT family N-acetyltransferase [Curtobacterium sp. PhB136]|uniref:GNAT family N-acetyltransferase n=1 Tax=Curtobacterium sp. PhB136 TaxID=2485181 RepID=UPI0014044377|nr:GNAT family N-acetyltransferase [Curtobacterium sp. PhB136]
MSDLPELLRQERAYMEEIEPESLGPWTAALDRNLALWIESLPTSGVIVDNSGAIAGIALWNLQPAVATLITIHVAAARRRTGIGGQLLEAFVEAAGYSGAKRAALGVHEANHGAARLYLAHGFHEVGADGNYRLFEKDLRLTA